MMLNIEAACSSLPNRFMDSHLEATVTGESGRGGLSGVSEPSIYEDSTQQAARVSEPREVGASTGTADSRAAGDRMG